MATKTNPRIRTRFAPSPTGYLHIGGLRTALFSYLWAKKNKGIFILRVEDTDQKRSIAGTINKLIKTLLNVGLAPDEGLVAPGRQKGLYGPYIQSKRLKIYRKAAQQLINKGWTYYCFCSSQRLHKLRQDQQAKKQVPRYDGHCRSLSDQAVRDKIKIGIKPVIRFRLPESTELIEVNDVIHGSIKVSTADLDDFILLKSDGYPTYHLANVVDDQIMKISHVIRGEEWLPSLPKHILLYRALGYEPPLFVHLPLLLNPDRSKLSKRQGDVAVEDFLAQGYLPEAILNYVALLGWNPGTDQEFFSLQELIKAFNLEKLNQAGAVFDIQKLNWFNAEYIRRIINRGGGDYKNLISLTRKFVSKKNKAEALLKLFGSRINYLAELKTLSAWLWQLPNYPTDLLIFKKSDLDRTIFGLKRAKDSLQQQSSAQWNQNKLFAWLNRTVADNNLAPGDVFWPVRVALSGQEKSPSPAEILEFLGAKESLKRINLALNKLGKK